MSHHLDFSLDVKHYLDLYEERGMPVSALRKRFKLLSRLIPAEKRRTDERWIRLEHEVVRLDTEASADEPNELSAIQALRPSRRTDVFKKIPDRKAITLAIEGAINGRLAGCVLGKPVECLMKEGDRGKYSAKVLKEILKANGEYPLNDYISKDVMNPYWTRSGERPEWFNSHFAQAALRENLQVAPSDDDIDYTVLGIRIVKDLGHDFTPEQVLEKHIELSPSGYGNFHHCRMYKLGLRPPYTATFLNAYREWILAQIRADVYGWVCPGKPAQAAAMAWADAITSNTRSGMYGAMWVAACLAAAYCEHDPQRIVMAGLQQVPKNSRFTKHILATVDDVRRNGSNYEKTFACISKRLGHYHPIHAINNACIVTAALLHGGLDFSKVISIAVMGGLDTDCNGATAGSIAGIMLGKPGIPDRWTAPFNGKVSCGIPWYTAAKINAQGDHLLRVKDLVETTAKLASQS